MKKVLLVPAVVLAMSAFVYAQGVAGKWTGEQQGRNGATPVTLELQVSGSTVSGSMTTGTNAAVTIADGKVDGNAVTFKTTQTFNGNSVDITWSGELSGDQLTLTRQGGRGGGGGGGGGGRGPQPLVLKRAGN
jgi:hypothetical protein